MCLVKDKDFFSPIKWIFNCNSSSTDSIGHHGISWISFQISFTQVNWSSISQVSFFANEVQTFKTAGHQYVRLLKLKKRKKEFFFLNSCQFTEEQGLHNKNSHWSSYNAPSLKIFKANFRWRALTQISKDVYVLFILSSESSSGSLLQRCHYTIYIVFKKPQHYNLHCSCRPAWFSQLIGSFYIWICTRITPLLYLLKYKWLFPS